MRRTLAFALLFWASINGAIAAENAPAFAAAKQLAHTLNVAFAYELPAAATQTLVPLLPKVFAMARQAHFSAVRLPINWPAHTQATAPYAIDADFLRAIDGSVQAATAAGLAVVLDYHSDEALMMDPAANHARFLAIQQQLSTHFRDAPPSVFLEILAEPHGRLDALWNAYLAEAIAVIRKNDATRVLIVGPAPSNRWEGLAALALPQDEANLIVTCHFYGPVRFTFQGETWLPFGKPAEWLGTQWEGGEVDRRDISAQFDAMASWAAKRNRPLFLGEFGASDNADMASRVRWTAFVRELAEARGFAWGYFNFAVRFSAFDMTTGKWRQELLASLLPAGTRAD
ncbi:MAG: glycoside hydrolase family 5 protein [Betaproteobacteria bacterium]|nr:glycoside hydrolase family 5 protein [Betaproteobacteria bacterium]